jgi:hypothetical protein
MGWNVTKRWIAVPVGVCGESGCGWTTPPSLSEAEVDRLVAAHWREHENAYVGGLDDMEAAE